MRKLAWDSSFRQARFAKQIEATDGAATTFCRNAFSMFWIRVSRAEFASLTARKYEE